MIEENKIDESKGIVMKSGTLIGENKTTECEKKVEDMTLKEENKIEKSKETYVKDEALTEENKADKKRRK